MSNITRFVLDKSSLDDLIPALQKVSFEVQRFSPPKTTAHGVEEVWLCCDAAGQLFSFSILEVNDQNTFGLKIGVVYLELGPHEKGARKRTRKEVSDAFKRFEHALIALGGKAYQPSKPKCA